MFYSRDKNIMVHAMNMGCKTAAQFASFLRARKVVQGLNNG